MNSIRYLMSLDFTGKKDGGAGGIRTLDRALQPYNGLANRRLQPLGHSSSARFDYRLGTAGSNRHPESGELTPISVGRSRPVRTGCLFDGRAGQHRFARFHAVEIVEAVPG